MAQTHASDLPAGFYTQAEVDNADKRIAEGEFADRDAALAVIRTERGADAVLRGDAPGSERESAGASFPPAGAAPSIGENASMGDPPVDAEPEERVAPPSVGDEPEPEVEVIDAEPEPVVGDEPEPEPKKGRRA